MAIGGRKAPHFLELRWKLIDVCVCVCAWEYFFWGGAFRIQSPKEFIPVIKAYKCVEKTDMKPTNYFSGYVPVCVCFCVYVCVQVCVGVGESRFQQSPLSSTGFALQLLLQAP